MAILPKAGEFIPINRAAVTSLIDGEAVFEVLVVQRFELPIAPGRERRVPGIKTCLAAG